MTPGAGVGSGALTGVQGPVAGSGQELAGEGDTWPHPGLGQIPASGGQGSLGWQGLAARRGRGCGSTLASDGVWLTERLCPPSPEDGRQQLWVDLKIHEPCSGQHIWFIKIAPSERRKAAPHPTLHQGLGASWLGPQLPLLCPPPIPSQRAPARPVPSLSPRPPWGRPPPKARPRPTRSGQAQGPRWPPAPRLGPHTLLPPGDRGLVQRTPCRALPLPAGGVPRGQRRRCEWQLLMSAGGLGGWGAGQGPRIPLSFLLGHFGSTAASKRGGGRGHGWGGQRPEGPGLSPSSALAGAEALPELPEGGLHGENGAQGGSDRPARALPGLLGHQHLGYLGLGGAGGAMKGLSASNTPWQGLPPDRLGVDGPGPQNLL